METTDDEQLLMSPGMDATIFFVQIGIDYIAYFPFSTLQFFELLNTKFLLKMKNEEGEGRLDITEEDEERPGRTRRRRKSRRKRNSWNWLPQSCASTLCIRRLPEQLPLHSVVSAS